MAKLILSLSNLETSTSEKEIQRYMEERKNDVVEVEIHYSPLDEEIDQLSSKRKDKDINGFLEQLFNTVEIGRNAKRVINPDLDYVVKFTPELLRKMEEHDIQFLKDKLTGDLLPDLYDYTAKGIGGKVRLQIKGSPTGQDLVNLSFATKGLIQQQRYEALVKEIHELHEAAKRIERGQDNERFAQVESGRKHLLDALRYEGDESDKKALVFQALGMLREGREKIEKTLLDKMDALEPVPEGSIKRLWKCFHQPEYFDEQTGRYNDIQEYFQYYYMSMLPMAYAYTYLKQPHLIEGLLEDSKKVFEHKNIKCLSSVEYLLPGRTFEGMWYSNPKLHEQKLLEAYKAPSIDENVCIRVKGREIIEVIGDGEDKCL